MYLKKLSGLNSGTAGALALGLSLIVLLVAAGAACAGDGAGQSFLRAEYLVLGNSASGQWQFAVPTAAAAMAQIGGEERSKTPSEFGTTTPEKDKNQVQGPSNTGEKVKAGLFSAILPGAGQYYNGQKKKAYIMGGVEVAIWTAYFVFDQQGDSKREDSEEWAAIYAGTSGNHADNYWQNVGHYANSDAYNEGVLREARALGEEPTGLVTGADSWQWVNETRQLGYSQLRSDGNAAYDRRDFMILFAVVNRAVSVVDAVIGAGRTDGVLETEIMGLNLEMEMLPSFRDPGARCVVSRSF